MPDRCHTSKNSFHSLAFVFVFLTLTSRTYAQAIKPYASEQSTTSPNYATPLPDSYLELHLGGKGAVSETICSWCTEI